MPNNPYTMAKASILTLQILVEPCHDNVISKGLVCVRIFTAGNSTRLWCDIVQYTAKTHV